MSTIGYMIDYAKAHGRSKLSNYAIVLIEEIMGDLSTTANQKVIKTVQIIRDMHRVKVNTLIPMDIKRPSAPTESPKEISHHHCTIDVSKIESLVLPEGGPMCSKCECPKCSHFIRCFIQFPTTEAFCRLKCKGLAGIVNCAYFQGAAELEWTSEDIRRSEA